MLKSRFLVDGFFFFSFPDFWLMENTLNNQHFPLWSTWSNTAYQLLFDISLRGYSTSLQVSIFAPNCVWTVCVACLDLTRGLFVWREGKVWRNNRGSRMRYAHAHIPGAPACTHPWRPRHGKLKKPRCSFTPPVAAGDTSPSVTLSFKPFYPFEALVVSKMTQATLCYRAAPSSMTFCSDGENCVFHMVFKHLRCDLLV